MEGEQYRMRIPDEDALAWIKTLIEGGFTNQEVDDIMSHLNDTYLEKTVGTEKVDEAVEEAAGYLESKDIQVTPELLEALRASIIERLRRDREE